MSAITIAASEYRAGKGQSVPVDVSNFSTLRLDFTVASVNAASVPMLAVELETASSSGGPWRTLHEFEMATAPSTQRVILSRHDNFVRVNWLARAQAIGADPTCVWGVTGDAKPDA